MTLERPIAVDVVTPTGVVRGTRLGDTIGFRGIPYGAGVDGRGRFRPSTPATPWTGVRDAFRTGPRAPQRPGNLFQTLVGDYFTGGRIGALGLNDQRDDENCLVLNVLTPDVEGARPVMVYLHGGGFAEGSGVLAVAAARLAAEQDVVIVSVNHRLNLFGFLALEDLDESAPESGNVGLLDLVLALEWVRDGISAFGGDPANVTILGESGGGGKVNCLLAMPTAEGLFHRAIVQSGSILRVRTAEDARADTAALLGRLGSGADIATLRDRPAAELIERAGDLLMRFRPVVDGVVLHRHPFDPDAPTSAAAVPLLVGHCIDEMDWLYADEDDILWLDEIAVRARLGERLGLADDALERVRAAYRDWLPGVTASSQFLRAASDGLFGRMATEQADRKSVQPAPVFRYVFTYDTPVEGGRYHAFHTAELPLVFRLVRYPEMEAVSQTLASQWAAFARSGNPSLPGLGWPAYRVDGRRTMVVGTGFRVEEDPRSEVRRLWESLPSAELFR